ncbi:hypothetical protein CRYUN_Cryun21dG0058500 [Craigia yunnanensis]
MSHASSDSTDGILSDEHFQRIKELKAKQEAKTALARQGFKIPSSDKLSFKQVDPAKLEAHVRLELNKEERLALVNAGREDRVQYQARTAVKLKKKPSERTQRSICIFLQRRPRLKDVDKRKVRSGNVQIAFHYTSIMLLWRKLREKEGEIFVSFILFFFPSTNM